MARTRGGEKRKATPLKKAVAESSPQLSLRDEMTRDLAMHKEELEVEITPAPGGKVTAPPSTSATPADKYNKEPLESQALEMDKEKIDEEESQLR